MIAETKYYLHMLHGNILSIYLLHVFWDIEFFKLFSTFNFIKWKIRITIYNLKNILNIKFYPIFNNNSFFFSNLPGLNYQIY